MSRVPMGGNRDVHGESFGWKLRERFEMISQGEAGERIADLWGLTRRELDLFSVASHARASRAADGGYFAREIVSVPVTQWQEIRESGAVSSLTQDETIRRGTTPEKLATLKSSFRPDGRLTAGNSSQISDGAAALLLMSEEKLRDLGLRPRARIRAITTVGSDPTLMLTGPIAATRRVLERAGLGIDEIDIFEVNEE